MSNQTGKGSDEHLSKQSQRVSDIANSKTIEKMVNDNDPKK